MSDIEKRADKVAASMLKTRRDAAAKLAPALLGEIVIAVFAKADALTLSELTATLEHKIAEGGADGLKAEAAISILRSARDS